jgi:hypothetical protein
MVDVIKDTGLCQGKMPDPHPKKGPVAPVCKGQEGIPTREEVMTKHQGRPLVMVCPAQIPPLDFTKCKPKCKPKYNVGTGGPLIKPGHRTLSVASTGNAIDTALEYDGDGYPEALEDTGETESTNENKPKEEQADTALQSNADTDDELQREDGEGDLEGDIEMLPAGDDAR